MKGQSMESLTFCFGDIWSPPVGTYPKNPFFKEVVEEGDYLWRIEFGVYKWAGTMFNLCELSLYSHDNKTQLLKLSGSGSPHIKRKVTFAPGEKLVSTACCTNDNDLVSIKLLIMKPYAII